MNKKMLIICAVFVLIISCKNYAIKDLEQKTKGQVNGFLDKILDPTKNKIASNSPKADELAKKLQEEEKEELMQGDGPNNGMIALLPVLPENNQDNTPVSVVKAEQQSGGQQEEKSGKVKEKKEKQERKEEKVEDKKEEQENTEGNVKEKEVIEGQEKQELVKAKEEAEQQKRQEEAEKKQVGNEIKTLIGKIDEINKNIDIIDLKSSFEERKEVSGKEVEDKVTGAIYDHITNSNSSGDSIYSKWSDDFEENGELKKLLEQLQEDREGLRNKIKEGKDKGEKNKDVVRVCDIKEDLEKLKSELEKVKNYLEDESNFEEIKGYIDGSNSY
ncbi:ErpC protein [Borreliella bissettiae]|uniref:ErpC protein n=1 Tax=Borrelia bissettiae TaxID=64897 RepID=UPI001E4FFFF4|nr:ErpC protein [Borreliella bissettiae]MCD2401757.1 ErpC protein [Borreliella bissettiae]